MTVTKKNSSSIKKSQRIQIIHYGEGSALNMITLYSTVGGYDKILDHYSSQAVKECLDDITVNGGIGISKKTANGVTLQVRLSYI